MHTPTQRAHARAQLSAADVSAVRGGKPVINHLDLAVGPGSRIAVVGENGRGKSTLVHLLDGSLPPDSGTVRRTGSIAVAGQEMPVADGATVRLTINEAIADSLAALADMDGAAADMGAGIPGAEARFATALERAEALDAWDAERRVVMALEELGAVADMDRRLDELSVGQRYRVRLACLLGGRDDFLLLDEPTNHLDRSGLDFMTEQLRQRTGGVVIVTHDCALLADLGRTIVDLDPTPDGRPRTYGGGYAGYRAGRAALVAAWEQEYDRQTAEHTRLQNSLSAAQNRLVSGWRPEKGSPKHGRATRAGGLVRSVHQRQEALSAHAVTVPPPPRHFRMPTVEPRAGLPLLTASEAVVAGRLDVPVSVRLGRGERLTVAGPNGAGKSTLLAMLAGALSPDAGSVRVPQGVRVGYLGQESGLPLGQRAGSVYAQHAERLVSTGRLPAAQVPGLGPLGLLGPADVNKRVGELSVGARRRLDLACVLAERPHVLLLDEPTNHLSIALVEELTSALRETWAAVVLATHDRQLLQDVADWPRLDLGGL